MYEKVLQTRINVKCFRSLIFSVLLVSIVLTVESCSQEETKMQETQEIKEVNVPTWRLRGPNQEASKLPAISDMTDLLKLQWGLSDEQASAIKQLEQEFANHMRQLFEQARKSGDTLNTEQLQRLIHDRRQKLENKINDLLTPEQRERRKEQAERMLKALAKESERRVMEEDRANWLGLKEEVIRSLALGEKESEVVLPLLDELLNLVRLQDQRQQDFFRRVREFTERQDLAKLLKDYRSARDQEREAIRKVQVRLHELLTLEQEAKLVGLNLLD